MTAKISIHNFWLFIPYFFIRYKVYVEECARNLLDEFDLDDFQADHYVFQVNNKVIGTARVIHKNNIAQVGRVSISKNYRSKGYGTTFISQLLSLLQIQNKAKAVQLLLLKDDLKKFYLQFGFKEQGITCIDHHPFIKMYKTF